jgi:hypothetical protein
MDVKWAITEDQLIGPAIALHQLKGQYNGIRTKEGGGTCGINFYKTRTG